MSKSEITQLLYNLASELPYELIDVITSYLLFLPLNPVLNINYKYDYQCILPNESVVIIHNSDAFVYHPPYKKVNYIALKCGKLLHEPIKFGKNFVSYTKKGFVLFKQTTFKIHEYISNTYLGQHHGIISGSYFTKQYSKLIVVGDNLLFTASNGRSALFDSNFKQIGIINFKHYPFRIIQVQPFYCNTVDGLEVYDETKQIIYKNLVDAVGKCGKLLAVASSGDDETMHAPGAIIIRGGRGMWGCINARMLNGDDVVFWGDRVGQFNRDGGIDFIINDTPIARQNHYCNSKFKYNRSPGHIHMYDQKLNIVSRENIISKFDDIWCTDKCEYLFADSYAYQLERGSLNPERTYHAYNDDFIIANNILIDIIAYKQYPMQNCSGRDMQINSGWIICDGNFYKPTTI